MVQWAERYRRLSKESSNGGRFIASRVEVARGPMLWATEPGVSKITLMACTQLLKTTCIENIAGRFIHVEPCPILGVFPKDDAAETFSKDRLAPMIRDTRVLRDLFGDAKSRDSGATLTHKQFPGGHITLVGANSPTNLAMRPIRLLVCDEIDKYPLSAGGEGSPIDLAEERQAEFKANSLTVVACSPTIAGRSAIEASYDESDQRKPFVCCPHCAAWQSMEWEQVRFDKVKVQFGVTGEIDGQTGGFVFTGVRSLDGMVSYSLNIRADVFVDGTITARKLAAQQLIVNGQLFDFAATQTVPAYSDGILVDASIAVRSNTARVKVEAFFKGSSNLGSTAGPGNFILYRDGIEILNIPASFAIFRGGPDNSLQFYLSSMAIATEEQPGAGNHTYRALHTNGQGVGGVRIFVTEFSK
ncbi:hypothetical protein CLBKND_04918 [Methylorubrum aminovorans]